MDRSSVDLPFEIIEVILSRCPAKSVVRFKSVSKSWLSIISDPRFSQTHRMQRSKLLGNQNKFLVWQISYGNGYGSMYLMRMKDGKVQRESAVMPPYAFSPLSSFDGLFLFRVSKHEYMLWNPSIRKRHTIILSKPTGLTPRPWHHIYHDATTDDYKTVFRYIDYCYRVYSSKNESWGEMKKIPPDIPASWNEAFVDGCLYVEKDDGFVCFDFRDGKLHKFRQPNDVECCVTHSLVLWEVSGRLCLYGFNSKVQSLEMWVMENSNGRWFDKCWRKLLCVDKLDKVKKFYKYSGVTPRCLGNEDDIVFEASYAGLTTNVMYNPHQKTFQDLDFTWACSVCYPYSENLYMPSSNIVC